VIVAEHRSSRDLIELVELTAAYLASLTLRDLYLSVVPDHYHD
jgi:hypothetical protein